MSIGIRFSEKAKHITENYMKEHKCSRTQAVNEIIEASTSEPQTPFSYSDLKGKKVNLKHLVKLVPCPKYDCWVSKEDECKGCLESQSCVMRP